jgi:pyruvate dehydrogenase (quinone)
VEQHGDVRGAIERAFAQNGPAVIDFVTDPRALAMPPKATIEEVKGFALTTSKLMFHGEFAEVWGQVRSNVRDVRQVL